MASADLSTSPWLIRVFDRFPYPLFALGISATLAFFVFFEVLEITLNPTISGDYWTWGDGFSPGLVIDVVFSIVVGYLVAVPYYIHREALRDFLSLRSALNCDDKSFTAAAIFLIPLYPLHRRIQAEKRSELARIRADIHRENEARIAGNENWVRLSGLIAYKQEIERVSTWAFNTPTMFRFSLYVSLGIGSWLGAAFVERWLGTLLGS